MADNKTITYTLKLDNGELTKKLVDTNAEINKLTASQKELKKSGQENSVEFVTNREQLKLLSKEYSETAKALQNSKIATDKNGESLNAMKAQLALVTVEVNKMTSEELIATKEGQKLIKEQERLTVALSNAEKAGGNFRRGVGDYNSEMGKSKIATNGFGGVLGGLQKGLSSVGGFVKSQLTSAFNSFGTALKANPIFFIGGIIVGVVAVMKKMLEPFQPVMEWLEDKIAYLSGLISGFSNSIGAIGDAISAVFSGDFAQAGKVLGDVEANIKGVAKAAENLNQVLGDMEIKSKALETETARTASREAELQEVLMDVTKSVVEKTNALKELKKIQETNASSNREIAREEMKAIELHVNAQLKAKNVKIDVIKATDAQLLALRLANKITETQYNDISASRKKFYEAESKFKENSKALQKAENKIFNEEKAKQNEAQKKQAEISKAINAEKLEAEKKANEEATAYAIKTKQIEFDNIQGEYAKFNNLEAEYFQNRKSKTTEFNEWHTEKLKEQESKNKEILSKRTTAQTELSELKKANELKSLEGTTDYYDKLNELQAQEYEKKKTDIEDTINDEATKLAMLATLNIEYNDKEVENNNKKNDLLQKKNNETFEHAKAGAKQLADVGVELMNSASDAKIAKYDEEQKALDYQLKQGLISQDKYDAKTRAIKQKQFEENKKTQISNIWVNAGNAVLSAWNTTIPAPYGQILAAIETGAILYMANDKANSVQAQKFYGEKGGMIFGNSHKDGGVDVNMQGGEYLINDTATEKYLPLLNDINNDREIINYEKLAGVLQSKQVFVVSHDISDQQQKDVKITNRVKF